MAGSNVTFTAAATGSRAPTVQWQVSTNSYGNPPTGKIAFFFGAKLLGAVVDTVGMLTYALRAFLAPDCRRARL